MGAKSIWNPASLITNFGSKLEPNCHVRKKEVQSQCSSAQKILVGIEYRELHLIANYFRSYFNN